MLNTKDQFTNLINQVAEYVTGLFEKYKQPYLFYHNLSHTKFVVGKAKEIAHHYTLNERELFILTIAAWFHDAGQLFSYGENHEAKSASIMKDFLEGRDIEQQIIETIENCILVTKIPHQPKSFLEEIMCDADTYKIGTMDFWLTDELLKKECEIKENKKIDNWNYMTLKFLERHRYFTGYCSQLLNARKQNNINIVRLKLQKT